MADPIVSCASCRSFFKVDGNWVSGKVTGSPGVVEDGICPDCYLTETEECDYVSKKFYAPGSPESFMAGAEHGSRVYSGWREAALRMRALFQGNRDA